MDPNLFASIVKNDIPMFVNLVQHDEEILDQRTSNSLNTVLHIASKFGHINLVKEVIKLRPEMVAAENKNLETPLHEACRQGNIDVVMVLLENNPWVSCKFNSENQSALFIACSNGHTRVVKLLLNQPWLVGIEEDDVDLTSLHVAVSKGHEDIVANLLNVCPNLAQKLDKNGYSPLHYACIKGRLAIAKMLLRLDLDLALQFDNNGYTPLHLAAMNGDVSILKEFMATAPASFQFLTKYGETVFHLAVRFNHYDAFICLTEVFIDTYIFHRADRYGNTVLHIAISRGHYQLANHIINTTKMEINHQNGVGDTALDLLNRARSTLEIQYLKELIIKIGAKTSIDLPRQSLVIEQKDVHPENEYVAQPWIRTSNHNSPHKLPMLDMETVSRVDDEKSHYFEDDINNTLSFENKSSHNNNIVKSSKWSSKSNTRKQKRKSQKHREELIEIYKHRHHKHNDIYKEALQKARDTITIVAVLIATITFTAGISPPGGVHQEGKLIGKAIAGRTKAFKVFAISNNIALFTSLCIVIVLVSIIPFRRKPLMKLLVIAHKIMWVAAVFMATAYVAAMWVIMPKSQGNMWTFATLVAVCSGIMGCVFVCLGVLLVKHWLRKLKWRKKKDNNRDVNGSGSSNSDVCSAFFLGYHAY